MGLHGQGTVTLLPNGRYRIAVTMADGKRVWRRARTPREAERVRKALVEARELDLDPSRQTVEGFLRSWIERQRNGRRIRARTLDGYERIVNDSIIPVLGPVTLDRLSRRKVQGWVDGLRFSPQTVRNHHAVLRKALSSAAGDLIPLNPAIGVELPKVATYEGHPLTAEEARRLLDSSSGSRLGPLWRLAIVTGLREGELLGLSRESLEGTHLNVTAQLQRLHGSWVLGPTKTARRLRLALDPETVEMLRRHLARMAEEREPSWRYFGLMFPDPRGEPYHAKTLLEEFHAACDRAGIARRRVHDLRHSTATLMRSLGVAEDTRMARLGHSTTSMARRYAHGADEEDRMAVERLAEAIR